MGKMLPGRLEDGTHARVTVLQFSFPGVRQGHGGFLCAVILRHQWFALLLAALALFLVLILAPAFALFPVHKKAMAHDMHADAVTGLK